MPCRVTWLMRRMRSRGNCRNSVTPSHSPSLLRSSRSATVNRCLACGSQREADEPRPHGVCVHSKPSVGLGYSYEHHRDRDGRDGPASDRQDAAALWRPVPAAYSPSVRLPMTAPPRSGAASRRPLLGERGGDKALGTGHAFGVLWKDVEVVRCGGPLQLQLYGGVRRARRGYARVLEPRLHHPRGNRGDRAGHAARRPRARQAAILACRLPFPRSPTAPVGPRSRPSTNIIPGNQIQNIHRPRTGSDTGLTDVPKA